MELYCAQVTIEQTAVPTALLVLPPGTQPGEDPGRPLVISGNDGHKFKILDVLGLQVSLQYYCPTDVLDLL